MSSSKVKLILHSRLEDEEALDVGWSPKYLAPDDRRKAQGISCLEIRIDGLRNDDVLYDESMQSLREIFRQLSDGQLGKAYLVFVEHLVRPKTKVRSYKGLFPYKGQIKQGEYIEHEIDTDERNSFFLGISPITKVNRDECFSIAGDFMRAFVLLSSAQAPSFYSRTFLESLSHYLETRGSVSFNYMALIPAICSDGMMMYSFGDTRGDYVNIGLFFSEEMKTVVQKVADDIRDYSQVA